MDGMPELPPIEPPPRGCAARLLFFATGDDGLGLAGVGDGPPACGLPGVLAIGGRAECVAAAFGIAASAFLSDADGCTAFRVEDWEVAGVIAVIALLSEADGVAACIVAGCTGELAAGVMPGVVML
jgi:hypothetical protein